MRVFVVHSQERGQCERSLRELSMERVREELEALRLRVEKGELKDAEKIGAAAAEVLQRHQGRRYVGWGLRRGKFHYFEHPVNFPREQACEGKYVIQTEERNPSPVEAVAVCKQLNEVERGFAHLKGLLEVGPVYHRKDDRVRALETMRCVEVEVGKRIKLCVTRGSRQAAEVLKILRLAELDPPPRGKETLM